ISLRSVASLNDSTIRERATLTPRIQPFLRLVASLALLYITVVCMSSLFVFSLTENPDGYRNSIPDIRGRTSLRSVDKCAHPKLGTDRIYTYDLPTITNYGLVNNNGNPRFKEYKIPVIDISEAYKSNLDELSVYVIPFSHVDPGYGMTMEQYFASKSRHTLDNMVRKLEEYPDLTFQWAETVFLERWWRQADNGTRAKMKRLAEEGRFEVVLGGWVMPDEAVTHFEAVVDQLIEGHTWLKKHLHVSPRNAWINDPFGYSSTMPYLWRQAGMRNMVILRIHQAIKATLMRKRALEFNWKPMWEMGGDTNGDMLCHLMSYRGYWIGDVCGPNNQHICREYAFMHENPRDKVVFLSNENIAERARILYEQYRITAELYRKHTSTEHPQGEQLFLPMFLGEDFSYVTAKDYDLIYKNYKMLFDYMNKKSEWKINIKFGTINDYFTDIKKYQASVGYSFPNLSGDFFPYSDYQNDYWTGYYSTRPFLKQLSRELQSTLKLADILHTYAKARVKTNDEYTNLKEIDELLQTSRRHLGVFQHHDGITGTSLQFVMDNFQKELSEALQKCKTAMKMITSQLLSRGSMPVASVRDVLAREGSKTATTYTVMTVPPGGAFLTVANSLPRMRTEVVTFHCSEDKVKVSEGGRTLPLQVREVGSSRYEVSFVAQLPPASVQYYNVALMTEVGANVAQKSSPSEHGGEILIENDFLKVQFNNESGFISQIIGKHLNNLKLNIQSDVLAYTAKRSGAYIFAPDGEAKQFLRGKPKVTLTTGNLYSEVEVVYSSVFIITTRLYHLPGSKAMGVFIDTKLDVKSNTQSMNQEVILRLKTDMKTNNTMFTDQNGFQLMGRRTYTDRATEENFYPITTMAIIQDSSSRLTLNTAQPHGAASLKDGWLEVMLDRSLSRDDGKGLGQGVSDNVVTSAQFVLHLESMTGEGIPETKYTYPSMDSLLINEQLNEPVYKLFVPSVGVKYIANVQGIEDSLPCDTSITVMRQSNVGTSMVLHRWATHCRFPTVSECRRYQGDVTLRNLFRSVAKVSAVETSLTHSEHFGPVSRTDILAPTPMQLRTFLILLS
ncbi:MA2A1-like protein, partial [Mya arenaria]